MDAVYIVRAGDKNDELRYSLRSVANLHDIDRVWIFGYRPSWVTNVEHVPVEQGPDKYRNVKAALEAAVIHPDVTDTFAYFNDDFFVMHPMDTLPALHRGSLRAVVNGHRLPTPNSRAMGEAADLLVAQGITDPLCYDLHAPLAVMKSGMAAALDLASDRLPERSLYGNLQGIGGELAHNFKVSGTVTGWEEWPFVSTLDSDFRSHPAGSYIRATFSEPSRYER